MLTTPSASQSMLDLSDQSNWKTKVTHNVFIIKNKSTGQICSCPAVAEIDRDNFIKRYPDFNLISGPHSPEEFKPAFEEANAN